MAFSTGMKFFSRPRLSRLRSWGRSRSGARKFVFLYHRVASPQHDPFALAVSASQFQEHLDILRSYCQMVTVGELLDTTTAKCSILASITFDDGYADNLTTALPILRQAGIPATFFICTGSLGDVRGFWWDRVATAIVATDIAAPAVELTKEIPVTGDLSSPDARRQTTLAIAERLRHMHPVVRDRVVEELETGLLAGSNGTRESCPVLDEAGVRELGSQPLAQLGAHTHSHPMLSVLTREEQLAEINHGAARLQEITGTRPRFVAYPYGGEEAYTEDSCRAARAAGLDAAFVNHAAPFDPKRQPYRLPRYYVPPLPAVDFRSWLQGVIADDA
jgi:peptidoglycan/xylan/chitin deacetylase (PgdA/CDA1 family)